jgi:hypothetical protein
VSNPPQGAERKVAGVQKGLFADLPVDEIVVVLDVEYAFVTVFRTNVIDLIRTILLAANQTF